jgi:hypothetical protein
LGLSQTKKTTTRYKSFQDIYKELAALTAEKGLILAINIDHEVNLDQEFFNILISLRNTFGWQFSYLIFASISLLLRKKFAPAAFQKVIQRNIIPILPLAKESSQAVIRSYEERYQKPLPKKLEEKIIELSGGNPGLIKTLYLQASETKSWQEPNLEDVGLRSRLQRILGELPKEYLGTLKEVASQKQPKNMIVLNFLKKFGYLTSANKIFSPLLGKFITDYKQGRTTQAVPKEEAINASLTRSQRLLLNHFEENQGKIITREDIAKLLWGESWADRYSDWAIDQLVHNLRRKLKKVSGVGKIQTKKREGFFYSS